MREGSMGPSGEERRFGEEGAFRGAGGIPGRRGALGSRASPSWPLPSAPAREPGRHARHCGGGRSLASTPGAQTRQLSPGNTNQRRYIKGLLVQLRRGKHLTACKRQEKPSFRLGLEDGRARPRPRASEGSRDPLRSSSTAPPAPRGSGRRWAQPEGARSADAGPEFCCPHSRPRRGAGRARDPGRPPAPALGPAPVSPGQGSPPPCTCLPGQGPQPSPAAADACPGFWEALGVRPGCGGRREAAVGLAPAHAGGRAPRVPDPAGQTAASVNAASVPGGGDVCPPRRARVRPTLRGH
ncbi:unnamed protein product [Rangifer tarandus platyrhynchus]|uniref:Uncharacterized protein n=1 Tax=Rangifer tarandus platyrhynchus TaxID=3082113 RepID=A0ABN9A187_RANTA|nr:unnamed protein product [Rangifer tarandus platyrhynchus]